MQWIADTGVDGFRLDAVKHIEDQWLLDLRARVSAEVEPGSGEHFYMVGETFTGDRDLIAYYVNSSMLDGQFDFPLRMQLVNKMIMRQGTMSELAAFMDSNDDYYGAGI
jgi:glycosidase